MIFFIKLTDFYKCVKFLCTKDKGSYIWKKWRKDGMQDQCKLFNKILEQVNKVEYLRWNIRNGCGKVLLRHY